MSVELVAVGLCSVLFGHVFSWCCPDFRFKNTPKSVQELLHWLGDFSVNNEHLVPVVAVGISALIWAIWKVRTDACFSGVYSQDPVTLVFKTAHFISVLQKLKW
jgi:hypothetical protein